MPTPIVNKPLDPMSRCVQSSERVESSLPMQQPRGLMDYTACPNWNTQRTHSFWYPALMENSLLQAAYNAKFGYSICRNSGISWNLLNNLLLWHRNKPAAKGEKGGYKGAYKGAGGKRVGVTRKRSSLRYDPLIRIAFFVKIFPVFFPFAPLLNFFFLQACFFLSRMHSPLSRLTSKKITGWTFFCDDSRKKKNL